MTTATLKVTIQDRNEVKYLVAKQLTGTPVTREASILDWQFDAEIELFEARRDYSLNALVPVLDFIAASKAVEKAIFDHRAKGGR